MSKYYYVTVKATKPPKGMVRYSAKFYKGLVESKTVENAKKIAVQLLKEALQDPEIVVKATKAEFKRIDFFKPLNKK